MLSIHKSLIATIALSLLIGLGGCEVGFNAAPSSPLGLSGASIRGKIHGGQQPVSAAHVHLMGASTSGYGSNSASLLSAGEADGTDSIGSYVLTGSDGSFSITGDYSCTSDQQLYILATQGNPGLSGSVTATQISLMAPAGECSAVSSSTVVIVNEVSTVVMAYALAGFASSPTQIATGTSAQAATDLANAFATVGNLEQLGVAQATTLAGNGTAPRSEINTLANILAACVNTSSGASAACGTLFMYAEPNGGVGSGPPADTAQAAFDIALNPGTVETDDLYSLQTGSSPFQPGLTESPIDFSLQVVYTASGMGQPLQLSVDATGNIWVPNGSGPLVELSPLGAQLSPTGGYTGGGSLSGSSSAVDLNGNIWVTDSGGVVKFDNSGNYIGTYTGGNPSGLASYENIAIDGSNNVWLAHTDSVGEYSNSGTPLSPSTGYATSSYDTDIRVDSTGTIWLADMNGYLWSLDSSGNYLDQYADATDGGGTPVALAIDGTNRIWVANSGGGVSVFTDAGAQTGYYGALRPISVAIDGAGSGWTANLGFEFGGTLSGHTSSGAGLSAQGALGYDIEAGTEKNGEGVEYLAFVAADGSGDLWVSETGVPDVREFVGLAVPVVTPITPSKLGVRP